MSSCSARFCEKSSWGLCEDVDQVGQPLDLGLSLAELVGVVEVGEVAAGQPGIGLDERRDDLRVDLVADVALAAELEHVLEARALGDRDRRGEVGAVAVLVGDVLDEQHEQDVVLVLAGVHAAAQLVARGPEGGVEVGFLDGHPKSILFTCWDSPLACAGQHSTVPSGSLPTYANASMPPPGARVLPSHSKVAGRGAQTAHMTGAKSPYCHSK